ncbi:MAG: putative flippase GtrA [Verrucomicrobiales bacterium]|jgi:putative flippase GtrA
MIGKLLSLLAEGFTFFRKNDLSTMMGAVLSRDAHPLLQFAKYVVCGGVAFMTHQVVALALGIYVFHDRAYDLDLRPAATSLELPQNGNRLVTIGNSGGQPSLRVFDAEGTMVVDEAGAAFAGKENEIAELQALLADHWDASDELPFSDQAKVINQVTEITGYDPDIERKRNSFINNTIAFAFATVVAYVLNVAFVFTSGRHSKRKEIFLFVAVSMVSYVGGMIAVDFVFRFLGDVEALASVSRFLSVIANLGFAVTSAMVNYVCRKYIIFQK